MGMFGCDDNRQNQWNDRSRINEWKEDLETEQKIRAVLQGQMTWVIQRSSSVQQFDRKFQDTTTRVTTEASSVMAQGWRWAIPSAQNVELRPLTISCKLPGEAVHSTGPPGVKAFTKLTELTKTKERKCERDIKWGAKYIE